MAALTEHEQDVLAFAKTRWNQPGAREQAVHDLFGMSMTRYLQELHALLERPEALAAEPQLVNRLRRERERARRARSARQLAPAVRP